MRKLSTRLLTLICGITVASVSAASEYRQAYPLPADSVDGWAINMDVNSRAPDDATMERLRNTGVGFVRCDFNWQRVENQKGQYDFSSYDGLVSKMRENGIRLLFILGYGNTNYDNGLPPTSAEARQAFANFARAAAQRYREQGIVWEIWNEPNHDDFWKPTASPDAYASLAIETANAMRTVSPDEWIIGPGMAGVDITYLERTFQRGLLDAVDAVSMHPYRNGRVPESVIDDWRNIRGLINRYKPAGKQIQVVSSEWGYSLSWLNKSQATQAQYAIRTMLSNMVAGAGVTVTYQWQDAGNNPDSYHDWFGLHDYYGKERQSIQAVRRFGQALKGYKLATRLKLSDPNDYAMLFTNGNDLKLVAWTSGSAHQTVIPASAGQFEGMSLTGSFFDADAYSGGLPLNVSGSPQILTPTTNNALLSVLARWTNLPSSATIGTQADVDALLRPALESDAWNYAPPGTTLKVEDLSDPANIFAAPDLVQEMQVLSGTLSAASTAQVISSLPRLQDRSDWVRTLKMTLTLPDGTSATQTTLMYHEQPLWAGVVTPQSNQLTLIVENPQGKAFKGTLIARSKGGSYGTQEISMSEGEYSRRVFVPELRSGALVNGYSFEIVSTDGSGLGVNLPVLQSRMLTTIRWTDPKPGEYTVPMGGESGASGTASAVVDGAPAGAAITGMKSIRIDYTMSTGWKYLTLNPPKTLAAARYSPYGYLGFWLYADGTENTLRARYQDESGQYFQYTIGKMDWVGWRWIEVPLDGYGTTFWGGANNGRVQGTVRIVNPILIDSRRDVATKGRVYVAGLTNVSTTD
jgi:hypothetical protein